MPRNGYGRKRSEFFSRHLNLYLTSPHASPMWRENISLCRKYSQGVIYRNYDVTPTEKPFQCPVTEWQRTRNTRQKDSHVKEATSWQHLSMVHFFCMKFDLGTPEAAEKGRGSSSIYFFPQDAGLATFLASVILWTCQSIWSGTNCWESGISGENRVELRDRKTTLWTRIAPFETKNRRRAGLASNKVCLGHSLSLKHRFFSA